MTLDQFELLALGGDVDSIKAAIAAGADACIITLRAWMTFD
ncbi:hypothetical protein [Photobacterium profundum]|nr:hypothetical protein [Photobacterium profundum]